jgi:hypothetical protein
MPHFKLGRRTKIWFSKIEKTGPLKFDFDLYYLCVLLGLATGRNTVPEHASDLVDYIIEDYLETRDLLVGLFLLAELGRRGIDLTEPVQVRRILDQLLDPVDKTGLSATAMSKLNEYANGGHEYLMEKYTKPPQITESFLQRYMQILKEAVSENDTWTKIGVSLTPTE